MTEKPPPLSTQIATPSQTVFLGPSPAAAPPVLQKVETVEEEPYTIKCICGFSDDDGNTIYCETCDTWQHIECFYPENTDDAYREDFAHSCAECKPRPLDKQRAVERQRSRLTILPLKEDTADKKPKRPPSKSHKKRPKPTDLQLNGHTSGGETAKHPSPHEHHLPLPKKAKTSHKTHQSISAHPAKRSPPYGNARANPNGHPPSPANTPPDPASDIQIHGFSPTFRTLYNNDDLQIVNVNSFAHLNISNMISTWLREPETMRAQTGHELTDVFLPTPANIDSLKRNLQVEDKKVLTDSGPITWQYLRTSTAIDKDQPLIELNGQIGIQKEYCDDPANHWEDFTSPLPFVFFHPLLPLYIDTRKEGSRARYIRRSCKPNAVLESYLSGRSEYHFWLVSDRAIAANEQITLPWDFRFPNASKARMMEVLGLRDDEANGQSEPDIDDAEYDFLGPWLFSYSPNTVVALATWAPNAPSRASIGTTTGNFRCEHTRQKKKARKPKNHALSPTSTGRATNSRAASEGRLDDTADNDGRSVSGSSRSKPPSRDMTPARQGSLDMPGILTEPTDRDKRKVAMVEDTFRRMEQQQPPAKKKRTSDGTSSNGVPKSSKPSGRTHGSHPGGQPNDGHERRYVDAGTSRMKSDSPASATSMTFNNAGDQACSPPPSGRILSRLGSVVPASANYVDAGVQTDPVEGEWYSGTGPCRKTKRRRVVSLSKRLLGNRHRLRSVQREDSVSDAATMEPIASAPASDMASQGVDRMPVPPISSPTDRSLAKPPDLVSPALTNSSDTPMPDATSASSSNALAPPAPRASSPTHARSPDLRVQMPPVPTFTGPPSAPTATTPLSATSPMMVQSPFSASNLQSPFAPSSANGVVLGNPSPVKKKLSLSDYTKSRMNKAAAGRLPLGTISLKPSTSNADEPTSATSADTAHAADSPTVDKAELAPSANPAPAPAVNGTS